MQQLNINNVKFDKSNIIILGRGNDNDNVKKLLEEIFYEKLSSDKEVFFFEESFDRVEYFPEQPQMGGVVKVRSNLIDGLKTYLVSIVIGKRRGVTIMVNSSVDTLIDNECMDLLRELVNNDSGCNLIISCEDLSTINSFNFDGYISF